MERRNQARHKQETDYLCAYSELGKWNLAGWLPAETMLDPDAASTMVNATGRLSGYLADWEAIKGHGTNTGILAE